MLRSLLMLFGVGCVLFNPSSAVSEEVKSPEDVIAILQNQITVKDNEILALKSKIDELQLIIQKHIEEPENKYKDIKQSIDGSRFNEAKQLIDNYLKSYPNSKYFSEVSTLKEKVATELIKIEKAKKEKEILLAEGFKKVTLHKSVTTSNTTLTIKDIKVNKNFVFDRYDNQYHYFTADKGKTYISFSFSVTSKGDPSLPSLYIGKIMEDGRLDSIKLCNVRLHKWESFGTYLGNEPDIHNDFAKVDTVQFDGGIEVTDEPSTYVLFTDSSEVYQRSYERLRNPPVAYIPTYSSFNYGTLNIAFFLENFKALKIINIKGKDTPKNTKKSKRK